MEGDPLTTEAFDEPSAKDDTLLYQLSYQSLKYLLRQVVISSQLSPKIETSAEPIVAIEMTSDTFDSQQAKYVREGGP